MSCLGELRSGIVLVDCIGELSRRITGNSDHFDAGTITRTRAEFFIKIVMYLLMGHLWPISRDELRPVMLLVRALILTRRGVA